MVLPDKVYEILKWTCLVVLPALAYGYSALSEIWNLPLGTQVSQTINIVATVIGVIIGVSSLNYYKDKENEGAE